jgi:hypothetical protein
MPVCEFDCQPVLHGRTLKLRALTASDFEALFSAASDPLIWAGHPAHDRYERQVFERYFAARLASGKALVVIDIESGQIVGMSSYYTPPDQPESIAIGYTFLVRAKSGVENRCRALVRRRVEPLRSTGPVQVLWADQGTMDRTPTVTLMACLSAPCEPVRIKKAFYTPAKPPRTNC